MKRRESCVALMRGVLAVGALMVGFWCVDARAQPAGARAAALTNDDVVRMVGAGFSDDMVIAKIQGSGTSFDTSVDALIALKKAGVSDAVVRAMIAPKASPAPSAAAGQEVEPGLYLEEDGALTLIEPTIVTETRTGNKWGAAFSYGMSRMKLKAIVPGGQARRQISQGKPVFHFYFGVSGAGLMFPVPSATSPSEFLLLRMEPRKDRREFEVGKVGVAEGASTDNKARVAFQREKVGPGHYRVTLATPLSPGEYCFFHPMAAGMAGAGGKVFDFGVRPGAPAGSERKLQAASR